MSVNYFPPRTASGGNVTDTGAIGSEPGSPTDGDLYFPNNSPLVERYNGSLWVPWGPSFPLRKPISGDYAWVNQGTAAIADNGMIYIADETAGSLNLRVRQKAEPATPYVITTCWIPGAMIANSSGIGIGWRESGTGELVVFSLRWAAQPNLTVDKYNSATAFNSSYTNLNVQMQSPIFLRIADDGANRICSYSYDGENYIQVHSVGNTDFLTADQVWFGLYVNTIAVRGTLLSWEET